MLYDCLRNDIEKTFGIFTATLEERKSELLREAKHIYNERQMALSSYNQKAQEVMGKLMVVRQIPKERLLFMLRIDI